MDGAAPSTPPQAFALHPGTPRRQDGLQAIPGRGHAAGGGGLIDTRAIGKLRSFSCKEEDWPSWAFVARGYLNLLDPGYQALISAFEQVQRYSDIVLAELGQNGQEKAVVLFNLLTQSVEGRALQIMMNVESGNGFQAWKALCENYEPDVRGRHTAMLSGIIAPSWESIKENDFLEALESWEVQIQRYEVQSREQISDSMKIAVLMKHAPMPLRNALRTAGTQIGANYERGKKFARDFLLTGQFYTAKGEVKDDGGPQPMDVGAVESKGKKGGKQGKDKGVNKGGKHDKSKGKAQTKKFNGECSYCYKWGHKKADCRLLAKDKARREGGGKGTGNSTNAVSSSPSNAQPSSPQSATAAGSTNAVFFRMDAGEGRESWADVMENFPIEEDYDEDKWVMMIERHHGRTGKGIDTWHLAGQYQLREREKFVLWDSGSDEHLCRPSFGGDKRNASSSAQLLGISGQSLGELKVKRVNYKIVGENGNKLNVETDFKVSEMASKDGLSAGNMSRNGFVADMRNKFKPFLTHPDLEFRIPLYLYCNSYTTSSLRMTRPSP